MFIYPRLEHNKCKAACLSHKYNTLLHYNAHVYIYSTCLKCLGLHSEKGIHFVTIKFTRSLIDKTFIPGH